MDNGKKGKAKLKHVFWIELSTATCGIIKASWKKLVVKITLKTKCKNGV